MDILPQSFCILLKHFFTTSKTSSHSPSITVPMGFSLYSSPLLSIIFRDLDTYLLTLSPFPMGVMLNSRRTDMFFSSSRDFPLFSQSRLKYTRLKLCFMD